jgi:hypothetical protein
MEGAMHDSRRYRDNAAACLLAAQDCQPYYRKLHLSMTTSWLSLARHDEAIDNLLASWDMTRQSKLMGLLWLSLKHSPPVLERFMVAGHNWRVVV